jgi:predicted enzyme related to lactoylglutathione lyase
MDHTLCHFEIPADEPERAIAFYRGLFGWDFQCWEGGGIPYWIVRTVPTDETGRPTRPGVNGGLMKKQNPQQPWANYFLVECVDEAGKKAEALGGQIVLPKTPVPGMGWFLYIKDTEGNIFGVWQSDPNAAAPAA